MRNRAGTTLVVATMALALPTASRAGIERNGAGAVETIDCRGESVQVSGAANELTLLGDCPQVEVYGAGNTVRIEQARKIEVAGFANKVVWERGPNGALPSVENRGASNSVRQGPVGSGAASPAEAATSGSGSEPAPSEPSRQSARKTAVVVADNAHTETISCTGNDVTVDGNLNKITLTGECRSVEVNGNGNVVRIAAAAAISSLGSGNTVTWYRGVAGKDPRVSNLGHGNTVSQASE